MHTLSLKCDKHPELVFSVATGTNRHDWLQLDEKGRAEIWYKDAGVLDSFVMKLVDHFTKCDGQMIKGLERYID